MKLAPRPVMRGGRLIGRAILGLAYIPAGCGPAIPPPPREAWTAPASTDSKAVTAPGGKRKPTAKEEDSRLSGRERRALLKQPKSG